MGESPSTGKHDGDLAKHPSGRWVTMIEYRCNCVVVHDFEDVLFFHIIP